MTYRTRAERTYPNGEVALATPEEGLEWFGAIYESFMADRETEGEFRAHYAQSAEQAAQYAEEWTV